MRVRVNFTLELDVEQYNDATEQDLSKDEVRREVQDTAASDIVLGLVDAGVRVRMLGRNNAYDPKLRTTRGQHLVT